MYVTGVSPDVTSEELAAHIRRCCPGVELAEVVIKQGKGTWEGSGYAFIGWKADSIQPDPQAIDGTSLNHLRLHCHMQDNKVPLPRAGDSGQHSGGYKQRQWQPAGAAASDGSSQSAQSSVANASYPSVASTCSTSPSLSSSSGPWRAASSSSSSQAPAATQGATWVHALGSATQPQPRPQADAAPPSSTAHTTPPTSPGQPLPPPYPEEAVAPAPLSSFDASRPPRNRAEAGALLDALIPHVQKAQQEIHAIEEQLRVSQQRLAVLKHEQSKLLDCIMGDFSHYNRAPQPHSMPVHHLLLQSEGMKYEQQRWGQSIMQPHQHTLYAHAEGAPRPPGYHLHESLNGLSLGHSSHSHS